jgi:autotransporter-associated beta strand protein
MDGAGTWDLSHADWSNGVTDQVWPNTTSSVATFGDGNGTAGVVNLSGSITAGGLVFNPAGSGNYNLTGSLLVLSAGTIQLANTNPILSMSIDGGSGLTLSGTGSLTLAANNDYSGTTSVNGATLVVASNLALAQSNLFVGAAGSVAFNASSTITNVDNLGAITIAAGTTVAPSSSSYSFQQASGTLTINGTLATDGGSFNYSGGSIIGTVTLNGSNPKLYLPAAPGSGTFLFATSGLIQTSIPSGVTVLFQPTSSASLEGQGTVINNGTLEMTSPNGGSIFIASNLTNNASFSMSANGTAGQAPYMDNFTNNQNATATINTPLSLYGNLVNAGTLNFNGSTLSFTSTSYTFNQTGGTISVAQGSVVSAANAGQFIISGGTISLASSSATAGSIKIESLLWPNPASPANPATDLAFILSQPYTSPQTPGFINLNGVPAIFNIADPNATLTITAELENGQITKTGPGTLALGGLQNIGGTLNITAGTVTLNPDLTLPRNPGITVGSGAILNVLASIPNVTITNNNGTVNFPTPNTPGIHIVAISQLALSSGMQSTVSNPSVHANRTLLELGTLSFGGATNAWQGRLDLTGNDMDVAAGNGTSLAAITNQVAEGYNGGMWTGTGGIISSAAAGDSLHLTALGVIQNNQNGSPIYTAGSNPDLFDGTTPGAGDVLVKYTYYGDGNLDGKVDGSDYSLIDNGFLRHATGWLNGDFNYDGSVNGSDYTLIDNSFNTQSTSLLAAVAQPTAQMASAQTSPVPEPAAVLLATAAAVGALSRRRFSTVRRSLPCRAHASRLESDLGH